MKHAVALVSVGAWLLVACSGGGTPISETLPPSDSSPGPQPLGERTYADIGFSMSVPGNWTESRHTVEGGLSAVLNFDPSSGPATKPKRAVDVIAEVAMIADVRGGVVDIFSRRFEQYRQIRLIDDLSVGGRAAFKHEFLAEGLRYDQWWVERDGGSFRITFWGPIDQFPAAGVLNDEIIATFKQFAPTAPPSASASPTVSSPSPTESSPAPTQGGSP
jgi:hypothetical protein